MHHHAALGGRYTERDADLMGWEDQGMKCAVFVGSCPRYTAGQAVETLDGTKDSGDGTKGSGDDLPLAHLSAHPSSEDANAYQSYLGYQPTFH